MGKKLEYKITQKVLKIFAQECSSDDLLLTLTFLWQGQSCFLYGKSPSL